MEKLAKYLNGGETFDATPLIELLLEQISADSVDELRDFADSAMKAAECVWFEVDNVEHTVYGDRYVVYAYPFNLPANDDTVVEVREW